MVIKFSNKIKKYLIIYKLLLQRMLKTLLLTIIPVGYSIISCIIFYYEEKNFHQSPFFKAIFYFTFIFYILTYSFLKISILGINNILRNKHHTLINTLMAISIMLFFFVLISFLFVYRVINN